MYLAYQSGQFSSASPIRFSCSPCATEARRIASASSSADPYSVAIVDSFRRGRPRAGPTRSAAGRARVDFLEQPAVAVGVAERGERPVVGVLRRRADRPVGVADVVEDAARVV